MVIHACEFSSLSTWLYNRSQGETHFRHHKSRGRMAHHLQFDLWANKQYNLSLFSLWPTQFIRHIKGCTRRFNGTCILVLIAERVHDCHVCGRCAGAGVRMATLWIFSWSSWRHPRTCTCNNDKGLSGFDTSPDLYVFIARIVDWFWRTPSLTRI